MPSFTASAPGKIILFGEHAVVYGQPAIAAPVSAVRTKAIIKPDIKGPAGRVKIEAPAVDLNTLLEELPAGDPIGLAVSITLEELAISQPPAFILRITSTIPMAGGLGSGAAVSVAVIRAVSGFLGHPISDERISALAYEIEKIHHGTPSGIDNTVITLAKPVYFIRDQLIETLSIHQPIQLMIADSGITYPTVVTVGDVRQRWERNQASAERVFASIGDLTRSARRAFESGQIKKLGELMNENHNLLQQLDVSSKALDHLIDAARSAGGLGAKLSGGGRGGNIITIIPAGKENEVALALEAAGATNTILTVLRNPDEEF